MQDSVVRGNRSFHAIALMFLAAAFGSTLMTTISYTSERSTGALVSEIAEMSGQAGHRKVFEDLAGQKTLLLVMAGIVNVIVVTLVALVESLALKRAIGRLADAMSSVSQGDYAAELLPADARQCGQAAALFNSVSESLRNRTVSDLSKLEKVQGALEDLHTTLSRRAISKEELTASLKEAARTASSLRMEMSSRLGRREDETRIIAL